MGTEKESMAESVLRKGKEESGWHISRSDYNEHLSIKNAEGIVIGHKYKDGTIKGTNQGGSGSLSWLQK